MLLIVLGDLDPLVLEPQVQSAFTPLPEALCLTVSELNKQCEAATLERIVNRLGQFFRGMHMPTESLIYEALGGLINEHKLIHTGKIDVLCTIYQVIA